MCIELQILRGLHVIKTIQHEGLSYSFSWHVGIPARDVELVKALSGGLQNLERSKLGFFISATEFRDAATRLCLGSSLFHGVN